MRKNFSGMAFLFGFVGMFFFQNQAYAILDLQFYGGMNTYEGKAIDQMPTSKGTIKGGTMEFGAAAHLYPIPFIPVGIGVFAYQTSFEKIEGDVTHEVAGTSHELAAFTTEPGYYVGGFQLAVNAPIAIIIDPYVRVGGGLIFGDAVTELTAGTNPATTALGVAGATKKLPDMKLLGAMWQAIVGLKMELPIPLPLLDIYVTIEGGYRSIVGMGILNADIKEVPTSVDVTAINGDLAKIPAVGVYQDINGMFGRLSLLFDL